MKVFHCFHVVFEDFKFPQTLYINHYFLSAVKCGFKELLPLICTDSSSHIELNKKGKWRKKLIFNCFFFKLSQFHLISNQILMQYFLLVRNYFNGTASQGNRNKVINCPFSFSNEIVLK